MSGLFNRSPPAAAAAAPFSSGCAVSVRAAEVDVAAAAAEELAFC